MYCILTCYKSFHTIFVFDNKNCRDEKANSSKEDDKDINNKGILHAVEISNIITQNGFISVVCNSKMRFIDRQTESVLYYGVLFQWIGYNSNKIWASCISKQMREKDLNCFSGTPSGWNDNILKFLNINIIRVWT